MPWDTATSLARPLSAGALIHDVSLDAPSAPVPDGDGGFTETWTPLDPAMVRAAIEPATQRRMESVFAGTVTMNATHLITMRYHPGITAKTRITFNGRTFQVIGLANPQERNLTTLALCTERVS